MTRSGIAADFQPCEVSDFVKLAIWFNDAKSERDCTPDLKEIAHLKFEFG